MKLGDYVEIGAVVNDVEAALAFYGRLGFRQIAENVLTDGGINLRLLTDGSSSPVLRYCGGDLLALQKTGLALAVQGDTAEFTAPGGLPVQVSQAACDVPMPGGVTISRAPLSVCGQFAELALPVEDAGVAAAFWERLGFTALHSTSDPYPLVIMGDGLIVIGLHQSGHFTIPFLTYFAPDSAERIMYMKVKLDMVMLPIPPTVNNKTINAAFHGPGDLGFFIFHRGALPQDQEA